jgi:hypothetical protein
VTLAEAKQKRIIEIQQKTMEIREIGMLYIKGEQTLLFNMSIEAQVNYTGYHNMVLEEILRSVSLLDYNNIYFIGYNPISFSIELMQFINQNELLDFAHAIKDYMQSIYAIHFSLIMQITMSTTVEQCMAIEDTR